MPLLDDAAELIYSRMVILQDNIAFLVTNLLYHLERYREIINSLDSIVLTAHSNYTNSSNSKNHTGTTLRFSWADIVDNLVSFNLDNFGSSSASAEIMASYPLSQDMQSLGRIVDLIEAAIVKWRPNTPNTPYTDLQRMLFKSIVFIFFYN